MNFHKLVTFKIQFRKEEKSYLQNCSTCKFTKLKQNHRILNDLSSLTNLLRKKYDTHSASLKYTVEVPRNSQTSASTHFRLKRVPMLKDFLSL